MIVKKELRKLLDGRRRARPIIVHELRPDFAKAINCDRYTVYLSWATIKKQKRRHPEITINDYLLIPLVLNNGLVVQDSPNSLIFAGYEPGPKRRSFRSSIKSDWIRDGLFLQSFHVLSKNKIPILRARYPVLRDFPKIRTGDE